MSRKVARKANAFHVEPNKFDPDLTGSFCIVLNNAFLIDYVFNHYNKLIIEVSFSNLKNKKL